MKPLLDRAASRAHDRELIAAGVPGSILMENAGRGAADHARAEAGRSQVWVLGGVGQNGGDAWVLARRLLALGGAPRVWLVGERARVRGDAAIALGALEAVGIEPEPCVDLDSAAALVAALPADAYLVDGLFGTGLDRPIEGFRAALIDAINARALPGCALDLPSGVDADTGAVLGVALRMTSTVTFGALKPGLLQHPGRALAGEVLCADIGVPAPVSRDGVLELSDAAAWLPRRSDDAHKGAAGHVVVFAGSPGTSGAALLAARGALRGGAGLVTVGARVDLEGRVLEIMPRQIASATDALEIAQEKRAAVVGPGLGVDELGRAMCLELAAALTMPAVLDADALTAVAGVGLSALRSSAGPRVLTPHPGEAARLLGTSSAAVQADRMGAARRLASESQHVVALKGAGTVVADPTGRAAVCPLGTPALGVAGTGDVLAGCLAASIATRFGPGDGGTAALFEATCAAVVLHAHAGELAAVGDRGLLASEVADALPGALLAARAVAS